MTTRIAYIVSPHGLGHASRSAAVLNALGERRADVVPQIFTTVPEWFFEDSLTGGFDYHRAVTDVGMVQRSPVEEDPAATLRALERIGPLPVAARELAEEIRRLDCRLAVCDISPLGLAAARLAGVPSVLVESFTWDWIYRSYFEAEPGLRPIAAEMAELFDGADLRIQTEPVCRPAPGALGVPPVYRRARSDAGSVRRRLGLDDDRPMVVITMGGSSWTPASLDRLTGATRMSFVVFAGAPQPERRANVLLLPDRSPVFVPDLIAAADLVVGKLGYGTVAEAWAAGTRYAYVPRSRFAEGESLGAFVRARLPSLELGSAALSSGEWLDRVSELLGRPRAPRQSENGAGQIGDRLARMLSRPD